MKVFVCLDNSSIYFAFKPLLEKLELDELQFFCGLSSKAIFSDEIMAGEILPLNIAENHLNLLNYDLGLSCHSKQIFPGELVTKVRCINIHPGFNPYNRGWFPQVFSLINNLPAGVTIHEMDEEIDHGPIIVQEEIGIHDWDTSLSVYCRLLRLEKDLFRDWLPRLISGRYTVHKPIVEGNTDGKNDFNGLCKIDLNKTVTYREAIAYLRAMSHPPHFNAYFESSEGKVFVRLETSHETTENV